MNSARLGASWTSRTPPAPSMATASSCAAPSVMRVPDPLPSPNVSQGPPTLADSVEAHATTPARSPMATSTGVPPGPLP